MKYYRWGIGFLLSFFLFCGFSTLLWGQATTDQPAEQPLSETSLEGFEEFEDAPDEKRHADPLYFYNISMFYFNDAVYTYLFFPVGDVYSFIVPKPVRKGVSNVFRNIGFPIRFTNSLLQGKFKRSGVELSRFGINTTVGLLGLFDPADDWFGLKHKSESFGQTLGHYKVPSGPYLVLPFLGPSTVRDAFGSVADSFVNPINQAGDTDEVLKIYAVDTINTASFSEADYKQIKAASIDFYSFMKDAYFQRQNQLIAE